MLRGGLTKEHMRQSPNRLEHAAYHGRKSH
eukprot:SAG11_NODE_29561_length_309_cov_1.238095_1_plen_29_part_01